MRIEAIPFVGSLLAAGADDHVFDALLVAGPIIIIIIAFLGRTPISAALAITYTGGFIGYIGYKGGRKISERKT